MIEKKRVRDRNYDDYGISKHRYMELKAFCRQYDEKKQKIKYGLSAVQYSHMPKPDYEESPTERQAIKNHLYKEDCSIIEEACKQANPVIWKYIMRSVTQGLTYEHIEFDSELGRIPVGKTDFYGYRKLFYHYLDKLKLGTN